VDNCATYRLSHCRDNVLLGSEFLASTADKNLVHIGSIVLPAALVYPLPVDHQDVLAKKIVWAGYV